MCCRNRGDISLTPLDVMNISKYLKMSAKDFISKYCEIGEDLDVHIRATGMLHSCIFLNTNPSGKNKCDIYKVRPMACYLYPLKAVPEYLWVFRKDESPFCHSSKKSVKISEFVREKSNGRYESEFYHIDKFCRALTIYLNNARGKSEKEMIEYFYYNSTVEELDKKLDDYIFGRSVF